MKAVRGLPVFGDKGWYVSHADSAIHPASLSISNELRPYFATYHFYRIHLFSHAHSTAESKLLCPANNVSGLISLLCNSNMPGKILQLVGTRGIL